MGSHFNHDCPHCLTRGAGFEVKHQWRPTVLIEQAGLLAICGVCKGGMTMLSQFQRGGHGHPDLASADHPFTTDRYKIVETWPKFTSRCPADVPANVEAFYNQGLENLAAGRWDAAGAMFRKSLDVATKLISPEKRAKNLYARINELVAEGRLTSAIGDWSHEIRLDGNDAVHDEEPETKSDAHVTQRFTEALLTYCFMLPVMVEANRSKRSPPANDAAAAAR